MIGGLLRKLGALRKPVLFALPLLVLIALPCIAEAQAVGPAQAQAGNWFMGVVGNIFEGAVSITIKPIILLILHFSAWILGVASVFFNWVVLKTVFQFALYFGTSDGMLIAWGVMRDVANIALLFGFIFMGVLLMLNVDGGGHGHGGGISARKAIPRLLIFAVLLNFSLFTTQFVIDVSNAFASQLVVLAGTECNTDSEESMAECANKGISAQILSAVGLSTIWSEDPSNTGAELIVYLGITVFLLITATVLIAAGIMLVIRVVVLSLLMVTSPIGFAGMVIPGLSGVAKDWWHKLISQSFYAPIMLLMVFISLKLVESLSPEGQSLVSALAGNSSSVAGNLQIIVVFAVVIGFMVASLIAATKFGAIGAGFATNVASTVAFGSVARMSNLAVGGTARVARLGVQRTPLANTGIGQVAVNRVFRPLEKTNLDMRRAGVGAILGAAGATSGAKAAEHATYGEMAHEVDDIRTGKGSAKLKEQFEGEVANADLERNAHSKEGLTEKDIKHLNSLSVKELEQLHGIKEGVDKMAQNLTPEQFSKLMDSKDLSDDAKGKLKGARLDQFKGLATQLATGDEAQKKAARDKLRKMSAKDLEQLASSSSHSALLSDAAFVAGLSDDQYDALAKSDKLSANVKTTFESARTTGRFKGGAAAATLSGMSAEAVSKLKGSVVADPDVYKNMTPRQLAAIDPAKLSRTELETVSGWIKEQKAGGTSTWKDFEKLMKANPKVKERWGGEV